MIEVKIESIDKEDLNTDVLFEIANDIFKGNPKEKQAKAIKETLEKAPSLEQMKEDLEMYRKIAGTLVQKIKEEEHRRKKSENHLIEKKVRTINVYLLYVYSFFHRILKNILIYQHEYKIVRGVKIWKNA